MSFCALSVARYTRVVVPFKSIPANNPKKRPDKCAVCAIMSPEPISAKSMSANKITVSHISSGIKKKRYTFIRGISTARVANTPLNAPLAPTTGLTAVKLQPRPATIPDKKKMSRNFELPIFRSSTGPKKTKKSILKKKCSKLP